MTVKLTINGEGRESKYPERALLTIRISSEGTDQAQVLEEVRSAAAGVQRQVEAMVVRAAGSTINEDGEITADSPVEKISTSSLSTGSYKIMPRTKEAPSPLFGNKVAPQNYNSNVGNSNNNNNGLFNQMATLANSETEMIKMYTASHSIDVRFRDFAELSKLTLGLSTTEFVTVNEVRWILLDETRRALLRKALRGAYDDALQKAEAYADGMGLTKVTPVQLRDNSSRFAGLARAANHAGSLFGTANSQPAATEAKTLTYAPKDVTCDANCEVIFNIE